MRRPTGPKGRSPDADRTPPGGRALERVQQDRLARGLPAAHVPEALTLDCDPPATAPKAARATAKTASKARKT